MKLDNTKNNVEYMNTNKPVVSACFSVVSDTSFKVQNILAMSNIEPTTKTYSSYFEILNDLEAALTGSNDPVWVIQKILTQNTFSINSDIREYVLSYLDTILISLTSLKDDEKTRIRQLFVTELTKIKNNDCVGIGELGYQQKMLSLWIKNLQEYKTCIDVEFSQCIERIQKALTQVNFKGDFNKYLDKLKQENKINSYEELEVYFEFLSKDLSRFLEKQDVFSDLDNVNYRLQETPPELKEYIPFAEYRYWPLYKNKENRWYITFNEWGSENYKQSFLDTFIHEFTPGHAYYYEKVGNLKWHNNLLLEGWAIYSENLLNELGYYDEEMQVPLETYNLLRILRMKIDLELQTNKITFEEAISILTEQLGYSYDLAKSEVLWYSQEATTPSSYYLWYLKIKSWREAYLAKGFTLKEFHDTFLNLASKTQKVEDFDQFFTWRY